ncbi:hypothetical protein TSOC_005210, partial [Tetrabaena socialis]
PWPHARYSRAGFSGDEREVLKDWVQQLGAQYSGDLVCRKTTHLVSRDLYAQYASAKYYKALEWGMAIVSFRWVYDSLQAGKLLPLAPYKSDTPGPADAALREAVQQRRCAAAAAAAMAAAVPLPQRIPFQTLCANNTFRDRAVQGDPGDDAKPRAAGKGVASPHIPEAGAHYHPQGAGQHADSKPQLEQGCDFTFDIRSASSVAPSPRLQRAASSSSLPHVLGSGAVGASVIAPAEPPSDEAPPQFRSEGLPPDPARAHHAKRSFAATAEGPEGPTLADASPIVQTQQQSSCALPTPSVDVGLSQLEEAGTLCIVPAADGAGARYDDSRTPQSGVSLESLYVTRRSATVRPTRLDLGGGAADGDDHSQLGSPDGAAPLDDAGSPVRAAAGADLDYVDLLTPGCGATEDAGSPASGSGAEEQPFLPASPQPQAREAASLLYSGFQPPLAAIATASKGRRLVRTDRLQEAVRGDSDSGGPDAAEDPVELSQLEDDLEDELEDEVADQLGPAPAAGTGAGRRVDRQQVATRADGRSAGGRAANDRRGLSLLAAPPPRSSLASNAVSVGSLRSMWQQRQQALDVPAAPGHGGQGRKPTTSAGPAAAAANGNIEGAGECCALVRGPHRPHDAQRHHGQPQLQQPPRQQQQQQSAAAAVSTVYIKAEPVESAAHRHLPVQVQQQLGTAACAADFGPGVVVKAEPRDAAYDGATAAVRPSVRRRAAALATTSLVMEPAPYAVPDGGAAASGAAGRGPTAKPSGGGDDAGAVPSDGAAGGYETASSAMDDVDGMPLVGGGDEPSQSEATAGAPQSRGYSTPEAEERLGQLHVPLEDDSGPFQKGPLAGPGTIHRMLANRTAGLTPLRPHKWMEVIPGAGSESEQDAGADDEGSAPQSVSQSWSGFVPRRHNKAPGPSRNAASVKAPALEHAEDDGPGSAGGSDGDSTASDNEDEDFRPRSSKAAGSQRPPGSRAKAAAPECTTSTSTGMTQSQSSFQQTSGQPQSLFNDDMSISRYLRTAVSMAQACLAARAATSRSGAGAGAGGGGGITDQDFRVVKLLTRAPRSNTVKERHPRALLKTMEFAEQIMVEPLKLLLNSRDRSRLARSPILVLRPDPADDSAAPSSRQSTAQRSAEDPSACEVFLAEPCVIYKLPSGEWWLEYYRFYSSSDVRAIATASGKTLRLPNDYSQRRELLRDTDRAHCRQAAVQGGRGRKPLTCVCGDLGVVRSKKVIKSGPRPGYMPAFWRFIFDKHTGEVLTDQLASDFVVGA